MALDPGSAVAVVGASLAGLRAAETLRADGHTGPLVVIGAEPHLPYDRPPLSKQFLAGTWGLDVASCCDHRRRSQPLGLDLRLGHVAGRPRRRQAGTPSSSTTGRTVRFDGLVLATGAYPRSLSGCVPAGGRAHVLRTLEDSIAIGDVGRRPGARVVVVGAGFIGSEVAATCRGLGADVTVVEALAQPLVRVLGPEMGAACGGACTSTTIVDLRTGDRCDRSDVADGNGRRLDGVELDDGHRARRRRGGHRHRCGAHHGVAGGFRARDRRTASSPMPPCTSPTTWWWQGTWRRWFDQASCGAHVGIEHWTSATAERGVAAARNLVAGRADAEAYVPVPYFWSDQYDVKIQMIGHPRPDDEVVVVEQVRWSRRRFVALYRPRRAGKLNGVGLQSSPSADGVPSAPRGGGELRRRAGASPRLNGPVPARTPARGISLRRARIDIRIRWSSSGEG